MSSAARILTCLLAPSQQSAGTQISHLSKRRSTRSRKNRGSCLSRSSLQRLALLLVMASSVQPTSRLTQLLASILARSVLMLTVIPGQTACSSWDGSRGRVLGFLWWSMAISAMTARGLPMERSFLSRKRPI